MPLTTKQKGFGAAAGAVALASTVGYFMAADPPRTRSFPTVPCVSTVGWGANELWPYYPQTQAPSRNPDTGFRDPDDNCVTKVEVGQLKTRNGVVHIGRPAGNACNFEWVPFNGADSNHCVTGSMYSSYRENWSRGPVHNQHGECKAHYEQLYGHPPTDMEWKDCDYNYSLYLSQLADLCRKDGGFWDVPTLSCRTDGTSCGDGTCQKNWGETSKNCRRDCPVEPPPSSCTNSDTRICLMESRFGVTVNWRDHQGNVGTGKAIPLTTDTGAFWFFADTNYELMVKVVDGRSLNNKFWVFYGALSDVEYTIAVTDFQKNVSRSYFNPSGTMASQADVEAFAP